METIQLAFLPLPKNTAKVTENTEIYSGESMQALNYLFIDTQCFGSLPNIGIYYRKPFCVKKKCLLAQGSDLVCYLLNQQAKLSPCPTIMGKAVFVTLAELRGRAET